MHFKRTLRSSCLLIWSVYCPEEIKILTLLTISYFEKMQNICEPFQLFCIHIQLLFGLFQGLNFLVR